MSPLHQLKLILFQHLYLTYIVVSERNPEDQADGGRKGKGKPLPCFLCSLVTSTKSTIMFLSKNYQL